MESAVLRLRCYWTSERAARAPLALLELLAAAAARELGVPRAHVLHVVAERISAPRGRARSALVAARVLFVARAA